ncbi:glycine-rich domain-containing protein [Komagataeibacter europaeus]|uniref:glycine-rich domain-containing protein n=1 Tax=Komagataeibacter europaeus TaxID=33995 RepID=UPI00030BFE45|nr:hypothetical protein [Komagataeibacter europaeus]GBQ38904.1 hypothetical protein AA18890_0293 [Komagataeibacter europaeus LMG 18890]
MELIIGTGTVVEASRDTMPATGTPGWATDGDPAATIPATDFPASHYNMLVAEVVQVILDSGLTLDRTNWGQLSAAIQKLIASPFGGTAFTPVQQGGGYDQVAGKVFLGRDTTYPGLRYSYVGTDGKTITGGGYLISSYGPESGGASGYAQIGDISQDGDGRMAWRPPSLGTSYSIGALLSDVTAETERAEAAEATLVSGTLSMAATDYQAYGLHWSTSLGAPMLVYGAAISSATVVQLAKYSDVTAETTRAEAAEAKLVSGTLAMGTSDYQGQGVHFNSVGRAVGVYNDGDASHYPVLANYADITRIPTTYISSGSFTVPAGIFLLIVTLVGGGGSGGSCKGTDLTNSVIAAGGGAGGYLKAYISVSPGDVVAFTVGGGGASPDSTIGVQNNGGDSYITVNGTEVARCTGGAGALWVNTNSSAGGAGGEPEGKNGAASIEWSNGTDGGDGQSNGQQIGAGNGAPGPWGGGGRAGAEGGEDGMGFGAGGGGAYDPNYSDTFYNGGAGYQGCVIVEMR